MESNIDSNEGEPNSQINFYTAPAAHLRVKTLIASDSMAGSPNNYKTISKLIVLKYKKRHNKTNDY